MKNVLLIFIFTLLASLLTAQVSKTVNVANAGTLTTLLTSTEKMTVTNLTLTGNLDSRDFKTLRDEISLLESLDLSEVSIKAYNGYAGTTYNITTFPNNEIPAYSFYKWENGIGKISLKSVILPNSITSISYGAFQSCNGLTSIIIPNSVTSIKSFAFMSCSELNSVVLGSSLVTVGGTRVFDYCGKLTGFTIQNDNPNYSTQDGVLYNKDKSAIVIYPAGKLDTEFIIPNSVSTVFESAFSSCSNLANVIIPNTVTLIGAGAFAYCNGLINLIIPNSVSSISGGTFSDCKNLRSISIPSTVNYIGPSAFSNCLSINSIVLPSSLTSIEGGTFENCTSLTSIVLPNLVTSIKNSAFYKCTELVEVNIPNSVSSIEGGAFSYCNKLQSINIPESLTSIGDIAFYDCSALKTIYSNNTTPPTLGTDCFSGTIAITDVYVPSNTAVTTYKSDPKWYTFFPGNIIKKSQTTSFLPAIQNNVKVYTTNNEIIVEGTINGETIDIYNLSGNRIQSVKSHGDILRLPIDKKAVVIVKIHEKSYKIEL